MTTLASDAPGSRIIYEGALATGVDLLIYCGVAAVVVTMWLLSRKQTTSRDKYLLLVFWGILPPLWFLLEYFYLFLPHGVAGSNNFFQYGQSVASKVWAAVFALISISLYADKQADDKKKAKGGEADRKEAEPESD